MTAKELAMIFYDRMVDNNEDFVEPEPESSKLMGEVDDELMELVGIKKTLELEAKILRMNCLDCVEHYVWGFEKALEVCSVVYKKQIPIDELSNCKTSK